MRQQALQPPLLLQDTEAEVARWLSQQTPDHATVALLTALNTPYRPWYAVVGGLLVACLILCVTMGFVVVTMLLAITLLALMVSLNSEWSVQRHRRAWLQEQLATCLAQGGREIPLRAVVQGLARLKPLPRQVIGSLTQRLARATEDELAALTVAERTQLHQRLQDADVPDVLRTSILLVLATLRDRLSLPYAQSVVKDASVSVRLREAAHEYIEALGARS